MSDNNPFNLVSASLWELLNNDRLNELVRPGNKMKWAARDEYKKNVITADLPELTVSDSIVSMNLMETSTSTRVTKLYQVLVSVGDFRLSVLNDIEWAVLCSLLHWCDRLTPLQYAGKSFVKRVGLPSGRSGITFKEQNRGIEGWSTVWSCEVEMHFKTGDLRSEVTYVGA